MGWIVAVILVLLGIGLVAAGFNGNALSFFDAFTGIVTPAGSSKTVPPTVAPNSGGTAGGVPGVNPGSVGSGAQVTV